MKKHQFLFEELVKRDFKEKYKRTVLGMGWSILSPILQLLVMRLVFTYIFAKNKAFYTTYLFSGVIVFQFFKDATTHGMTALIGNASIISKINVPKYLLLLSKNVSTVINFLLTLVVFFIFAAFDGVTFTWQYFLLLYPIMCLVVINLGVGLILSACYVFFRDMKYLYEIFTMLLRYLTAIFYYVETYPPETQKLFLLNPIYCIIKYFRSIVIDNTVPSLGFHALIAGYTIVLFLIGARMYKRKNQKFVYYI
ncbi:MAG: ABC transporter permease [Clostridia bacterium]|nr:ABC transporter permease [Clostridia bacterium]